MVAAVPELPEVGDGGGRRPRTHLSRLTGPSPIRAMDPFSLRSVLALDVYRTETEWCVEIDVPGVDSSEIEIEASGRRLTISAHRRRRGADLAFGEREHGRFSRELLVSDDLDLQKRRVIHDEGVLTIAIPLVDR